MHDYITHQLNYFDLWNTAVNILQCVDTIYTTISSVGISVYRFFTIFQSADIAGIVIEKISPYRLFPICRLFVDIENVYRL